MDMDAKNTKQQDFDEMDGEFEEENDYDDFELLERLESLREDMEELGVKSIAEVNQRIKELHHQMDDR